MKWKFIILFLVVSTFCYGQRQDSVICLPKTDIVTLANKVRLLRDSLRYKGNIIFGQDTLIKSYKKKISVCEEEVVNRQSTIGTLKEENEQLQKTIELLRPKWYDNKWLWFGGGAAVVTTLVILTK